MLIIGAACFTHPLDLMKVSCVCFLHHFYSIVVHFSVHLQTQQHGKLNLISMAVKIYTNDGILAFYNGLSASLLRQVVTSADN
jgi:dicarboxylate transporter 10